MKRPAGLLGGSKLSGPHGTIFGVASFAGRAKEYVSSECD